MGKGKKNHLNFIKGCTQNLNLERDIWIQLRQAVK